MGDYTKGMREYAHRRALRIFDEWVDVTGFVQRHTSYYYELQALIEDGVECGAQAALGIFELLEAEMPEEADSEEIDGLVQALEWIAEEYADGGAGIAAARALQKYLSPNESAEADSSYKSPAGP
jgi:hypothetical protein